MTGDPIFILSTGRTGTQFFQDYLNDTSTDALCRHEPHPSRRFKFLSNLYLERKAGDDFIIRTYLRSRRRIFRSAEGKRYIESSNFIFGCIPSLNKHFGNIRIIHIVRHPVDYVKSHLGHGFWRGYKRFFARHVPYWLEHLELEDPSDPLEILAKRWVYVNRQIHTYKTTNPYLVVSFEDLFSREVSRSSSGLNRVREFCSIPPLEEQENRQWLENPQNYSRQKLELDASGEAQILEHAAPFMLKLEVDEGLQLGGP